MRWMTMAGVLVVLLCAVGVGDVDARPRRRWVCEEWRDYIYNAETGAFIAWSGETLSVSWGGSRGFAEACRVAADHASLACLGALSACEEPAEGCR